MFAMVENTAAELPISAQILVVEDEHEIRELMSLLLLRQGYRVEQCGTAVEAKDKLRDHGYDLMVLDWMLPQMSGLDLLKSFGEAEGLKKPPVLMVTAKAEAQDIVQGLEAGADDYITKPFEPGIFAARVKALLRRAKLQTNAKSQGPKEIVQVGNLSLNLSTYEVRCCDELLHLTPSEFKIMAEMANAQGRVMTRDYLVRVVQGDGISVTGRTIDTHVFGLRKKLGTCADWIETIRGVGYRLRSE
jgi:DNA-binding response OmpR family regulator